MTVASLGIDRVLRITGTDVAETIDIRQESGSISVVGVPIEWDAAQVQNVNAAAVDQIVVDAHAGDDVVRFDLGRQPLSLPTLIDAGAGDDTIYGGAGNDEIFGGDGRDLIHGNQGDDRIEGGNSSDWLYGDAGNDDIGLWLPDSPLPRSGFPDDPNQARDGASGSQPVFGNIDPPQHTDVSGVSGSGLTNVRDRFDTNSDGFLTPLDALLVINALNQVGPGKLPEMLLNQPRFVAPRAYVDANQDGSLTPIDALVVINCLNAGSGGEADDIVFGEEGNVSVYVGTGLDRLDGGEGKHNVNAAGAGEANYDRLYWSPGNDDYQGLARSPVWSHDHLVYSAQAGDQIEVYGGAFVVNGQVQTIGNVFDVEGYEIETTTSDVSVRVGADDALISAYGMYSGALFQGERQDRPLAVLGLDRVLRITGTDGTEAFNIRQDGGRIWIVNVPIVYNSTLVHNVDAMAVDQVVVDALGGDDVIRFDLGGQLISIATVVNGGAGNDTIYAGAGNDEIVGGDGRDFIHGNQGDDRIDGNEASDWLYGDEGNDELGGGNGDDVLDGGIGDDVIIGGLDNDWFVSDSTDSEGPSDITFPQADIILPNLNGYWWVRSNGLRATIQQDGRTLLMTDENGTVLHATLDATPTGAIFAHTNHPNANNRTVDIRSTGAITQIVWEGNSWDRGELAGNYFVRSNGLKATVVQLGDMLFLTDEYGGMTQGQWLSPTHFSAWGQQAVVVQENSLTRILWNGNAWERSQVDGDFFVHSNHGRATVHQTGDKLLLTDEYGNTTEAKWINARQFSAWGQTTTVIQEGFLTRILWNGNSWERSEINGDYFVHSTHDRATIRQTPNELLLTDEHGNSTVGTWLNATQFIAWGQTVTIVQEADLTRLLWSDNSWDAATNHDASVPIWNATYSAIVARDNRALFNPLNWAKDGFRYNDIKQGGAGICTIASALASAAAQRIDLSNRIRYAGDTAYDVFLYEHGWQTVTFDGHVYAWDLQPTLTNDHGVTRVENYWPLLFARAYLQAKGVDWIHAPGSDDENWNNGFLSFRPSWTSPKNANYAIAGGDKNNWDTSEGATAIQHLANNVALGSVVTVSTLNSAYGGDPSNGTGHMWAVIGLRRDSNAGGGWRVTLYNPWGLERDLSWNEFQDGFDTITMVTRAGIEY